MNERIQALANEATCFKEGVTEGLYDIEIFDKEKFAELIVQDNIQTLRGNGYDDAAQVLQDIHFGIEDPV
jgi:hypothetical protein